MQKKLNIPNHIGFIMDGNGRWAKKRKIMRTLGHKKGAEILQFVLNRCYELGIKVVSIYAFSTENFKRSKDEVDAIFEYCNEYLIKYARDLKEKGIRFMVMGDIKKLPEALRNNILQVIEETKNNTKGVFNVALAYGGRDEIVWAVNNLILQGKKEISEDDITNAIYTKGLPDPDLIVRASGEQRLSNFMLWQSSYSELYFPKTLWPDFNARMVDKCIKVYNKRNRRFGHNV